MLQQNTTKMKLFFLHTEGKDKLVQPKYTVYGKNLSKEKNK